MKKMIIYGYNMEMGGAEKALINILNLYNNKYSIDLVLLEKKGILLKDIPDNVRVFEIKTNLIKYAAFRFISPVRKYIINSLTHEKYDLAVAFMEGRAATFVADLKQSCKKIAWIHNDVNVFNIGINQKEIIDSYNKMDKVIAVSKQSMDSFIEKYEFDKKKIDVIYNLIDEKDIIKKSKAFNVEKKKFTFVNVAKMRKQKRHDRLLDSCKILKNKGYDFEMWLIGNGPLEEEVKKKIKDEQLEGYVKMLGLQENPFPYVKCADYFVMSSDHEGYPLSLLESLLLKTKIITTDVSGAKEMLENGKFGYIVPISTEELVKKMEYALTKTDNDLENNIKLYKGNNLSIKKQLDELFVINEK